MKSVCLSVRELFTRMYCATAAEPIEMPFAGWLVWAEWTMHWMGSRSTRDGAILGIVWD